MRKLFLLTLVVCAVAFAQSSGNFAARIATTQCTINESNGNVGGGLTGTVLDTTIKTPNSSSTALLIRPSLVTGLYTKSKVDYQTSSSTAKAGVAVRVLLDGAAVAPGTPVGGTLPGDGWVYFDKRYQQLSSNLFNLTFLQDCDLETEGIQPCYIELIQSTLGAHSMDFVIGDVGGGTHNVKVEWKLEPTAANSNEAACVGPGVLTVQQVKTFSTSGGIDITQQN